MSKFEEINLNKQLRNAISDLGFENQTPIQEQTYSKILGGKDIVGIAQTAATNSSTSATVIFPAIAISGLKFLAVPLKIRFPAVSPFQAFTNAKSAVSADSKI